MGPILPQILVSVQLHPLLWGLCEDSTSWWGVYGKARLPKSHCLEAGGGPGKQGLHIKILFQTTTTTRVKINNNENHKANRKYLFRLEESIVYRVNINHIQIPIFFRDRKIKPEIHI